MERYAAGAAPAIEIPPAEQPAVTPVLASPAGSEIGDSLRWAWLLWENRKRLVRSTALGLAIALVVSLAIPNRYQSTTEIMPPDQQSSFGAPLLGSLLEGGTGSGGGLGALAAASLGMKGTGDLFIDVLRSRTVADQIVDRFHLQKVYWDRYRQDARRDLAKNTQITENKKSGVITVTVTDRNPQRATEMARAYVDELDKVWAQVSTSAARRERVFIEGRLQAVKQNLQAASTEFSQYASKNTAIDISAQEKAMLESAATLQGELIAAQAELDGLQQIYTNSNVRVRSLQARIEELKKQSAALKGGNLTTSDTSASDQYPAIQKLPLLGVRWAELYREAKVQEAVYQLLTQQYEMAKIQEAKEIPSVKLLDAAVVPEKKSFPPRALFTLLGGFFGFGFCTVFLFTAAAWEALDPMHPLRFFLEQVHRDMRDFLQKVRLSRTGS